MKEPHWQDWLMAVVGLWLILANWVLAPLLPGGVSPEPVAWNYVIAGAAALTLGVAAIAAFRIWEEWAGLLIGLWLMVSPWVLGFVSSPITMWNVMISGLIIVFIAGWSIYDQGVAGRA